MIAALLVAGAIALAYVLRRRQPDTPVPSSWAVPTWLDRGDFADPDAPWLVVVFTSSTCHSCQETAEKARPLASAAVAVAEVEVLREPELHRRYGIEAVPTVVIADRDGEVRASFIGPPTATDLWAKVAELREPGSVPPGCDLPPEPAS